MTLFAGIEAGGTKFICAIGDANGKIHNRISIPTTSPAVTMKAVIEYFQSQNQTSPFAAIGIATFGPIDLDPKSKHYGYITTPPKPGWANYDIYGTLKKAFNLPLGFDTDVNGAAMGEYRFGAAQGLDTFVYVTVGTGIGAGGMISGKLMHGLIHPEMGHIFVPHDMQRDNFKGVCPFHGDCLEGLATGPAIQKRWGLSEAQELPIDHPGWDLEAEYLAAAFANYALILSPQKIIAGGGVMQQKHLFPKIRSRVQKMLNGYIKHEKILSKIDEYIVPPGLGNDAGICGAIALAESAVK
jgi:fructokinase